LHKLRLALIPLGAILVALLSYGTGFFGAATEPPVQASVVNPVAQPVVPPEAAPIAPSDPGAPTDTDRKIAFWQVRIEANPGSDVQYQYLGELFSQKARETGDLGKYSLAREAFEAALERYPGNAGARAGLAATLLALHAWPEAIGAGTALLQSDPRAHAAVAVIGDASLEIGDLDTAASAFETLRQVAGGPAVEARFARLAFLNGDTESAIRILKEATVAAAAVNRPPEELAFYQYSIGEYRFSQGEYEGADDAYRASLEHLPGYHLPLAGRGRVAYARGDLAGAIDAYRQATAIIPRPEWLAYLGDLLVLSGDDDAAEQQYGAVDFIAQLGDAQAEIANRDIALFQASHRRDTGHAVTLARAELEVRKDVYGYDALAWALYNDGKTQLALGPARQAVALGTRDARLLYHLGMIELDAGLEAAGVAHLQEALALNPAFDPLGAERAREALGG
jgi:tetratricopeptide (TPR) repeat protein